MKSDREKLCNILSGMAADGIAGAGVLMRDFVAEHIGGLDDVAALITLWGKIAERAGPDEEEKRILVTLAAYGASTFAVEEMRRMEDEKTLAAEESEGER